MLVTINPSVGGVSTDAKTRFFNFLASLHAVATAAAGATPVVNPVNTSGVKNTSFNCISVISNTQAGGWTAGVSNNITASTSYNSSNASAYIVDLFEPTGKSTYPYYRLLFGNYTYTFSNANFASYPQANIVQGHTNNDPASVAYTSDTSWFNGTWSFLRGTTNWTTYPTRTPLNIATADTTYYVAVTERYLIISHPNELCYFGIRDVAPWELTRTDNPPWVAFGFNGASGADGFAIGVGGEHFDYQLAWMSTIDQSNTVAAPVRYGSQSALGTNAVSHAITGQRYVSASSYVVTVTGSFMQFFTTTNAMGIPFSLAYPVRSAFLPATNSLNGWRIDSPVTDPVTGLSVPPAYPIVIYGSSGGTTACSGRVPGMLKGMSHTATGLTTFASASEYVINGQAYQPVLTGNPTYPDLFLLLKA